MRKYLYKITPHLLCLPILWVAMSCAKAPESSTKIIGGHVPDPQSPAATSTVALIRNDADDHSSIFCSGTLIAPNLVVTAAHCLEIFRSADQFSVVFGPTDREKEDFIVPVAAFKMFKPEGSQYFPNFDIGWIKLAHPAPRGFQPVEIFHDASALPSGHTKSEVEYILAGYGLQATTCMEADCVGKKLEVATRLRDPVYRTSRLFSILAFGDTPGYGSCNGDSGGSAFARIHDRWYLIGATNGITAILNPAVFATSPDQACEVGESLYTFIGDYAAWIEKSSGITLDHDSKLNPRVPPINLEAKAIPAANAAFADWYAYADHRDPAWYATDRIALHAAMQHQPKDRLAVFQSPKKILATFAHNPQLTFANVPDDDGDEYVGFSQQLQDVRPIATLPLKHLDLRDHAVTDFSPLGRLTALETLTIRHNVKFKKSATLPFDTSFVNHLTKLRSLDLSGTRSLKLSGIDWRKLRALRELRLDGIGLSDIKFLRQLPALQLLSLSNNKIRSLAPLKNLKSLREIYLSGNPLTDTSDLDDLPALEVVELPDIHSTPKY